MNEPKTKFEKIWAKSYSIFLVLILIFSLILKGRVFKMMSKKAVFLYVVSLSVVGYIWTILSNSIAQEPAWAFTKISIWGYELFNMVLEDWFFYPVNAFFFLVVLSFFNGIKDFKHNRLAFGLIFTCNLLYIMFFSMLDIMGLLVSFFYIFPAMCFMSLFPDLKFNSKVYMLLNMVLLPFSTIWDLNSTLFRVHWLGDWAVQWYYPKNNFTQIGLMFSDWDWSWVLGVSPISITPYFSIGGILFAYTLYLFIQRGKNGRQ